MDRTDEMTTKLCLTHSLDDKSDEQSHATNGDFIFSTEPHDRKGETRDPELTTVFKKLSLLNGTINRMTKEEIKQRLKELKLDSRGKKDVVKKRLKTYYKKMRLQRFKWSPKGQEERQQFKHLLVIDFEATCEEGKNADYQHEIIEFPVVLLDVQECKIISEFHEYVRPEYQPYLSAFCTRLTGIEQYQIDRADTFPVVLRRMEQWMVNNVGQDENEFAVVCDGPWDMDRFMQIQCKLSNIPVPSWAKKWVNIRKTFGSFYGVPRCKITEMLDILELPFQGKLHSGIDDSRNIAQIVLRLIGDSCTIYLNEWIGGGRPAAQAGKGNGGDANGGISVENGLPGDYSKKGHYSGKENVKKGFIPNKGERNGEVISKGKEMAAKTNNLLYLSNTEEVEDLLRYHALQSS